MEHIAIRCPVGEIDLSKAGYFLKPCGKCAEFDSEIAAESFKEWLQMGKEPGRWPEVAVVDMFEDPVNETWIVTQYMRVLTKISDDEKGFAEYTESIRKITKANKAA